MTSMEDLIDSCGGFGRYQILVTVGILMHKLCIGWSMLQMTYAGFIPDWYCLSGDPNTTFHANGTFRTCSLNDSETGYSEEACHSHWFEESAYTAVSQWDLVCDRQWIKATITSIQMAGVLLGAILSGQLADTCGRKKTMFGFSLMHSLLNFGAALSVSWEMFAVFRFFIGMGIGALLVVTFTYPLEFMPTRWRPALSAIPIWGLSMGLFAVAALFINHWSFLHIACGAVGFTAIFGYFHIPESIRWLTLKGRYEEADEIFQKMASVNGKTAPKTIRAVLETIYLQEKEARSQRIEYSYLDLFRGRRQIKITLVFNYLWFSLSAAYYGISFGISSLAGNLYLNIFLLAVVEAIPVFFTFYFNNKIGRKWTCISLLVIGTASAFGCLLVQFVVPEESRGLWITALCLTAKLGLSVAWINSQIWINELHPTVIRNLGFGLVNTTARIGGILAPFAINFDNAPFTAYALISAMLVVDIVCALLIPDTKGKMLEDSLHQQVFMSSRDDCSGAKRHSPGNHKYYTSQSLVTLSSQNGYMKGDNHENGNEVLLESNTVFGCKNHDNDDVDRATEETEFIPGSSKNTNASLNYKMFQITNPNKAFND